MNTKEKRLKRITRHLRLRKRILGSKERPRLCVYRGLANVHAQLIDDINGKTLLSVSTQDKEIKKKLKYGGNVQAAKILGEILAERSKSRGFGEVVFDRCGFLYKGRIKALAESAREHGLKF